MSRDSNRTHWLIITFLLLFSFLGLVLCRIIELFFLGGERQIMKHPFWSKAVIVFGIVWCVSLAVLVPIQILVFDRKERRDRTLQKLTIRDLFCLPFGAANPNAKIPKWIKIPVLSILFLLLGIFVIFFVMLLLTYLIS
jgi:uncharacterized membrane protein